MLGFFCAIAGPAAKTSEASIATATKDIFLRYLVSMPFFMALSFPFEPSPERMGVAA